MTLYFYSNFFFKKISDKLQTFFVRHAEEARLAEEKRLAANAEAQKAAAEAQKAADEKRAAEEKLAAEQKRVADEEAARYFFCCSCLLFCFVLA